MDNKTRKKLAKQVIKNVFGELRNDNPKEVIDALEDAHKDNVKLIKDNSRLEKENAILAAENRELKTKLGLPVPTLSEHD
jgi:regulator of replication initiation timing